MDDTTADPKVELIAWTQFRAPDSVPWQPEGEGGEDLIQMAGRACYQSWGRPRPETATNAGYIAHILDVGHNCYDEETEVLCADGWKAWPEVTEEDQLATRTSAGVIQYHRPTRLIAEEYNGTMVRVESNGVDLLVTPNHRMLACPTTTKQGRRKLDYQLIPAADLVSKSHAYIKTGIWAGGADGPITADEARILGFAVGDANISGRGKSMRFHLTKQRKLRWLVEICERNGWELKVHPRNAYSLRVHRLDRLVTETYLPDGRRCIPHGLIMQLDQQTAKALLEGLVESDGSRGRTGVCFDTTSPVLADQVQQLALHAGLASNIASEVMPAGHPINGVPLKSTRPIIRQHLISRNVKPEVNKWSGQAGKAYRTEYTGRVFCATVPNHTLYVRRNGIPVWSGNSVLEHATATFYFTGVSRSFTHELIRHRHLSFSQLSQRYVDESDAAMVVPNVIAADPASLEIFRQAAQVSRDAYEDLVERQTTLLADSDLSITARRKQARQAARAVLPNATETRIVVTGNVRAWRHFIDIRATEHADVEICEVAMRTLLELRKVYPHAFADYDFELLPDGREIAVSKHADRS